MGKIVIRAEMEGDETKYENIKEKILKWLNENGFKGGVLYIS